MLSAVGARDDAKVLDNDWSVEPVSAIRFAHWVSPRLISPGKNFKCKQFAFTYYTIYLSYLKVKTSERAL